MARSSITIHRDYLIINGFVQVPHNTETDKTRVTVAEALAAISGSQRVFLSIGSGPETGYKTGAQSILRLPGLQPGASYSTNPVTALEDS